MRSSGGHWQPFRLGAQPPTGLEPGTIHVWQARFSAWEPYAQALAELLDPAELARMGRFRGSALAARYAIGRGFLRMLVGAYSGAHPAHLRFASGSYGKPQLASNDNPLNFNLAHSGNVLMAAITRQCEVGVDVERIDAGTISPAEARRIMADSEWSQWQPAAEGLRMGLFFQTWVRKESALKALGVGLHVEPDTFTVGFEAEPAIDTLAGSSLCVRDLQSVDGYAGAVAWLCADAPRLGLYHAIPPNLTG